MCVHACVCVYVGGWVLHKLSSCSACITRPTVQRRMECRPNTPPSSSSVFLSFPLSVSFSFCSQKHHNAVDFRRTERNVCCRLSAFVLSYGINQLQHMKTAAPALLLLLLLLPLYILPFSTAGKNQWCWRNCENRNVRAVAEEYRMSD